jgi:hypothetical protein
MATNATARRVDIPELYFKDSDKFQNSIKQKTITNIINLCHLISLIQNEKSACSESRRI